MLVNLYPTVLTVQMDTVTAEIRSGWIVYKEKFKLGRNLRDVGTANSYEDLGALRTHKLCRENDKLQPWMQSWSYNPEHNDLIAGHRPALIYVFHAQIQSKSWPFERMIASGQAERAQTCTEGCMQNTSRIRQQLDESHSPLICNTISVQLILQLIAMQAICPFYK